MRDELRAEEFMFWSDPEEEEGVDVPGLGDDEEDDDEEASGEDEEAM